MAAAAAAYDGPELLRILELLPAAGYAPVAPKAGGAEAGGGGAAGALAEALAACPGGLMEVGGAVRCGVGWVAAGRLQ
jgi:hypothetical protein